MMRNLLKTLALVLLAVSAITACSKESNKPNTALVGNWKNVGSYISNGGPQYYVTTTENKSVTFGSNSTLSGNFFADYNKYSLKDSVTIKMYNGADTTKYESYYYRIKHDTLTLGPREPYICIEGCSFVFVKE